MGCPWGVGGRSVGRISGVGASRARAFDGHVRGVPPDGAAYVFDGLWRCLGIDKTLAKLLEGRKLDARAGRVLFALVVSRAIGPFSKLAATSWVDERVAIDGLDAVDTDACYRVMDWLLEVEPELAGRREGPRRRRDVLSLVVQSMPGR